MPRQGFNVYGFEDLPDFADVAGVIVAEWQKLQAIVAG